MVIPLGTDRPLRRPTVATWTVLVLTIGAFIAQLAAGWLTPEGRFHISNLFALHQHGFRWWMPFTYLFLHDDWWHLAGNMLFLWVFAPNIEDRFGRIGFLLFYLLGGAAAGLTNLALAHSGVIGASGAVAACTGAYIIMFPLTTVRAFSLLFVIGMIAVPAWWFIGLSIVWDLAAQGSAAGDNIAHLAHLGGYAFGAAVGFALLALNILPREHYDVFSMVRQAHRRRQIKSAATGRQRQVETRVGRTRNASASAPEEAPAVPGLAEARAEIARLLAIGDAASAGVAYKHLAEHFPAAGGATTFSRTMQYTLANHFFTSGDQGAAVYAYERFLGAYPKDAEAPHIRLLLGRINARYLNDPVRAKALLTEAMTGLRDEDSRLMARRELEALG